MNIFTAIFLGVVQGLTEFLPVSSSGHLVLFQKLIPGFDQPGVLFDVVVHFGTLASVFYFFRKKIFSLSGKYFYFLVIGSLPTVMAGFFFRSYFEEMFANPKYLGYEFLVTSAICFLVDSPTKIKSKLNTKNALVIGAAQAISIVPAISRSGATILAGVKTGLKKREAAEFSFLLSIPAILGANILQIYSYKDTFNNGYFDEYFFGFLSAFLVGGVTIGFLLKMLVNKKFKYFGFYSLILGLLTIFFFRL